MSKPTTFEVPIFHKAILNEKNCFILENGDQPILVDEYGTLWWHEDAVGVNDDNENPIDFPQWAFALRDKLRELPRESNREN